MTSLFTCVITASSPSQAEVFRALIKRRIDAGLYPREIEFLVCSDPQGGRVGSGGGTLLALASILDGANPEEFFSTRRILIIHAGGESRRLPCYVPEGKLFAPIPVPGSSIIPPVILDMHLTLFLKYPWKRGEVVISSGDVILDFDTTRLPPDRGDICGFAKAASFEQGARHGVFVFDHDKKTVVDFLQKASADQLAAHARIEGTAECALDIGLVSLSPAAAAAFIALGQTVLDAPSTLRQRLEKAAAGFDLYLEVMTAGLRRLSGDDFTARVKGASRAEPAVLEAIYKTFHRFDLTGVLTHSSMFLHYGSLSEFPRSCLEIHYRGLRPFYAADHAEVEQLATPELVACNCIDLTIPVGRHKTLFAEGVRQVTVSKVLGDNLLIGLDGWSTDVLIPAGMCIDRRSIEETSCTLVYSVHDTFKPQARLGDIVFCGTRMDEWLSRRGLPASDLWDDESFDLTTARLFPENGHDLFLAGYWQPAGERWSEQFRSAQRYSIQQINNRDSALVREERRVAIRTELLRRRIMQGIGWKSIALPDFARVFGKDDAGGLNIVLDGTDDELLRSYRTTLMKAIDPERHEEPRLIFAEQYVHAHPLNVSVKQDQIVWARSSVRLDLAGGWSDTPPYTLRHGGQVVNLSVDLNGQPPIQVFCRRMEEPVIRINSIDLGISQTISSWEELTGYHDPSSAFGLPKAALCLMGLLPQQDDQKELSTALSTIGCGIEITLLCAVPKGSGLGTSSVLGATILAALHRFFGQAISRDELILQVLQLEQMLTTGGGWQDQIGGIVGGVKYIESRAGIRPVPVIHQLDPFLFQDPQTHGCFTLFYTGITRLAKNILRDVVHNVNANTPAYLFTLDMVRNLACQAREAIGLRDLARIGEIVALSWEANRRIHPSASNEEVDRLLSETRTLYRGAKLLGAGGGGYALFISDTREQAGKLRETLAARFENEKARIVDFSLDSAGLVVTVS